MGIALVLDTADFSANALKTISLDDYTWNDITIASSVIHKNAGFMWGDSGTTQQKGNAVSNTVWGSIFAYTDLIAIPSGAKGIKGLTSVLDISFSAGNYSRYPAVNFYNTNNEFVDCIDSEQIYNIVASVNTSGVTNPTKGYKGNIRAKIPSEASKYRLQWIFGNGQSNLTGDVSQVVIDLPSLQFGFESSN